MIDMRSEHGRPALVAAVALTAALALPVGGVVLPVTPSDAGENATSGETLAGALAAQGSTVQGDLDRRELAAAAEQADGESATAAVLAERRLTVERQVQALAERQASLREARRAGELAPNAYRVRRTRLAARAATLRELLRAVRTRSEALSPSLRETYGLDAAALNRSRLRVEATDAPGDTGLDGDADAVAENRTERALRDLERRQAELRTAIEAVADDAAGAAVACSRMHLGDSRAATNRSRDALATDAPAAAEAALVDAATALSRAIACLAELESYESMTGSYGFDRSDTDDDDEPTWNESDARDREFDRTWTPTPTPTPSRRTKWSWENNSDGGEGKHRYPTPTPTG
jgi:hypothetical protein